MVLFIYQHLLSFLFVLFIYMFVFVVVPGKSQYILCTILYSNHFFEENKWLLFFVEIFFR